MNKLKKFSNLICFALSGALFSSLVYCYWHFAAKPHESLNFDALQSLMSSVQIEVENDKHPENYAKACALMDANSGELLLSKNADEKLPMASTTKIMTAIIVLENCALDETVTITKESQGVEGSSIYLLAGETLSVHELLYGLMLESGNDAATALAIHTAGNIEDFCRLMNKKASDLGLSSTNFENPHGLSSQNHFTTAKELAIIASYAMKNEHFRQLVSTEKYVISERENCRGRYFSNHNRLLKSYDICDGIKTGYTKNSGRCLVTSTSIGESRFVVVTLDDRNDWNDHKELHEFAANNFESVRLANKDELNFVIPDTNENLIATNKDAIYITRKKGKNTPFDLTIELGKGNFASGEIAGYMRINDDENCFLFPLVVR